MSSEAYMKAHLSMTAEQKEAMWDLWMSGVNRGGSVWVTYTAVEECVAKILAGGKNGENN